MSNKKPGELHSLSMAVSLWDISGNGPTLKSSTATKLRGAERGETASRSERIHLSESLESNVFNDISQM